MEVEKVVFVLGSITGCVRMTMGVQWHDDCLDPLAIESVIKKFVYRLVRCVPKTCIEYLLTEDERGNTKGHKIG